MTAEVKWMINLRKAFGVLVLISMIPTGMHFYQTGKDLVDKNPGLFLLEYMWVLAPIMAMTVSVWIAQGVKNPKEGYWLYWFFVILSLISCSSLGGGWVILAKVITFALIVGALIYHVIWSSVNGMYSFMSTDPTKVARNVITILTVFLSYFTAYALADLTQSVYGIILSVLIPVFVTLVGIKVWRNDSSSKDSGMVLAAFFVIGLAALIYLRVWVVLVFALAVLLGVSVILPRDKDDDTANKTTEIEEKE